MRNARPLSCHRFAAIFVVLVAMVATTPAYAKTQPHKLFPTASVSLTKAQQTSIAGSLKTSTGLKPSQLTTENYCDKPRKGHVICNLQVLAVRHTHKLVHPRANPQHKGGGSLLRSWTS